jgi:hypothetical protein
VTRNIFRRWDNDLLAVVDDYIIIPDDDMLTLDIAPNVDVCVLLFWLVIVWPR